MLGAGELLLISFLFLTSLNCLVTYICSSSCIKLASKKNDYLGAIKKLRKFDNYLLSTLLLVTAVIYVALMYFYFVSILEVSDYFIAFATIGGFIATLFTTFFSRLCYCYACNFILKTKLDEYPVQGRGGKGLKCSGDQIVGAELIDDTDNVLLVGVPNSICISTKDIPELGRVSLGNQMIKNSIIKKVAPTSPHSSHTIAKIISFCASGTKPNF